MQFHYFTIDAEWLLGVAFFHMPIHGAAPVMHLSFWVANAGIVLLDYDAKFCLLFIYICHSLLFSLLSLSRSRELWNARRVCFVFLRHLGMV